MGEGGTIAQEIRKNKEGMIIMSLEMVLVMVISREIINWFE